MNKVINSEYYDLLNLHGCIDTDLEKLLNEAKEIRKFEIEMYWERAKYFILFAGAIFTGYCAQQDTKLFLKFLLNCAGYLVSLLWYFSNRGAKFWQENWEKHVDFLEGETATLYKVVIQNTEEGGILSPDKFSVAKCNTLCSLVITIAWYLLLVYNCLSLFTPLCCKNICVDSICFLLILLPLFLLLFSLWLGKFVRTNFQSNKEKKINVTGEKLTLTKREVPGPYVIIPPTQSNSNSSNSNPSNSNPSNSSPSNPNSSP